MGIDVVIKLLYQNGVSYSKCTKWSLYILNCTSKRSLHTQLCVFPCVRFCTGSHMVCVIENGFLCIIICFFICKILYAWSDSFNSSHNSKWLLLIRYYLLINWLTKSPFTYTRKIIVYC